jgi:hypothetical protein
MADRDYGSVQYNGQTLAMTQYAYCDNYGTYGAVRYYAQAKDADGNVYRVAWDTTAEWDALEPEDRTDESDACDWSAPVAAVLIGDG